jgi:DNA-binding HxlR family transcriptional regulator
VDSIGANTAAGHAEAASHSQWSASIYLRALSCQALGGWLALGYAFCMRRIQIDGHQDQEPASECIVPKGLSAAFDLLQEKWALAILYVLTRGPNGFNVVGRGAGDVNSTTLAQRLVRLEQAGLVSKTVQSVMPPRTLYRLTEAGEAFRPVLQQMEAWGRQHLASKESG